MVRLGDQTIWQHQGLEWMRYEYNLNPEDTVLDLGSYRMEFANKIKEMYGCKVECFEALDNMAAWTHNGTIKMGGQYYYSSMYEENADKEYKCVDIKPYLQKEIALMKINIEGAEYELLKHIIENGLHKNVKNIQVQFHLVDGIDTEKLYKEISDELTKTHKLTWRYPFVWENWELC